ncbi:MAG: AraC family transcriptional regulator [Mycobacteriaceae bacterium]|nr:AraC family transcriptional regulator [Mycobacteriaceae bacterium]
MRDPRELAGAWRKYQRHTRASPPSDLAPYVEYLWSAEWHYERPYRQLIVPLPNVHLTFRDGEAVVNGVRTRCHTRLLHGAGRACGVAFRHAGFRPFLSAPVASITDRELGAAQVLPATVPAAPDAAEIEECLRACLAAASEPRDGARLAEAAMAAITGDSRVTSVAALARQLSVSIRTLQRAFAEHVGVSPKWVVRRYRLHEVTELLSRGREPRWSELAFELGYVDQAHLIRDFKSIFGEPPEYYRQRYTLQNDP